LVLPFSLSAVATVLSSDTVKGKTKGEFGSAVDSEKTAVNCEL
jgi:hypothetical protein